jgi:hypothetical protein
VPDYFTTLHGDSVLEEPSAFEEKLPIANLRRALLLIVKKIRRQTVSPFQFFLLVSIVSS